MITVAIIEDNRLVREGITAMLNDLPDVKVVLAATSLETTMLKECNPRVVLLDVGLQDRNSVNFMHSYGVDGLVGAKVALTNNASLRVDGVVDWLANESWQTYKSVRVEKHAASTAEAGRESRVMRPIRR